MIELRVLELLCARFCHEMVSPVGAVSNGVELLDEDDPDFVREAMTLIGQSARTASRRLQFYRFAYGTTPVAGNMRPRDLLMGLLEGGKVSAEWGEGVSALTPEWQRIACNLAVIAAESLPRGGRIVIHADAPAGVAVEALGDPVLVNPDMVAALSDSVSPADLTSRTIHGYVTAKFTQQMGGSSGLKESGPGRAVFAAKLR